MYDASGTKLAQKVYDNNMLAKQTTYVDGFIYEQEVTGDRELSLIHMKKGASSPTL